MKYIKQLICALVFGHNFQVWEGSLKLSDLKCTTCGKESYFWKRDRK